MSRENFDFDTVLAGVKKYAKIWLRYANIYFDFIDGLFEEGQIRIAFHPGVGHYSHVGIPEINRSEATMNFDPDEINADIHPCRFQGVCKRVQNTAAETITPKGNVIQKLYSDYSGTIYGVS